MAKLFRRRSQKGGLPPGTLIHIGQKHEEPVKVTVIDYDQSQFEQKQISDIGECFAFKKSDSVTWINIDGISDVELIEKLGEGFELHPLLLEDILNTTQRPKLEDFEHCIFVVVKMLSYNDEKDEIQSEQVSLILGSNFVISFQELAGDVFERIRARIRESRGRIRKMGCDYLFYSLLDAIVDGYFSILEKLEERIEELEDEVITNPKEQTLEQILRMKRDMIALRRSIWPLREVISELSKSESSLVSALSDVYMRDVYDHTIQVIDTIEAFRDVVTGMLDIYLSSLSNSMNSVMKVLTIIATIFIPLTFIAGIYGMNFKYMPELDLRWAYPLILLVMLVIGGLMLLYFWKKKWF